MLCSSYLYSGFFRATPDASSALCLVLHCTAPLDVSKSPTCTTFKLQTVEECGVCAPELQQPGALPGGYETG